MTLKKRNIQKIMLNMLLNIAEHYADQCNALQYNTQYNSYVLGFINIFHHVLTFVPQM